MTLSRLRNAKKKKKIEKKKKRRTNLFNNSLTSVSFNDNRAVIPMTYIRHNYRLAPLFYPFCFSRTPRPSFSRFSLNIQHLTFYILPSTSSRISPTPSFTLVTSFQPLPPKPSKNFHPYPIPRPKSTPPPSVRESKTGKNS